MDTKALSYHEWINIRRVVNQHWTSGSFILGAGLLAEYTRRLIKGEEPHIAASCALLEAYHVVNSYQHINQETDQQVADKKLALDYLMEAFQQHGGYTKRTCRGQFKGSQALFNACWRKLLSYRHSTDINTQEDADNWLDSIAAEMVNNSRSRFYMKG